MRVLFVSLAVLAASPALAQDGGSSLTLASAQGAPAQVIIDGADWVCDGPACRAASGGLSQPADRACRRVVSRLGPVTAFVWNGEALSAERLAACNKAAGKRGA